MKKNIFVHCETVGSVLAPIAYELLTKGRALANDLGAELTALIIGSEIEKAAIESVSHYGAHRVYWCDDARLVPYTTLPYTRLLAALCEKEQPEVFLIGATAQGRDLAPRVAARLRTGLTAHCTTLEIADSSLPSEAGLSAGTLLMTRPALGGNIAATIVCPERRPQMASVTPRVFVAQKAKTPVATEVVRLAVDDYVSADDWRVKVLSHKETTTESAIHQAEVVVCGGFGVGSKKNFALLEQLAAALGGTVAATRAAVDAGFAERSLQIGQTGLTVRPRLFIACGCSGAIQFTSGMKDSGTIVSINSDAHAPINTLADYVVVGEVEEVLPKMIQAALT